MKNFYFLTAPQARKIFSCFLWENLVKILGGQHVKRALRKTLDGPGSRTRDPEYLDPKEKNSYFYL